jgi:ornithine carbamoyltransferase
MTSRLATCSTRPWGSAEPPNDSETRHFLDLADFSGAELRRVLDASAALKARRRKGERAKERPLEGKVLAMVFDKPSTRTRVSSMWACANSAARP